MFDNHSELVKKILESHGQTNDPRLAKEMMMKYYNPHKKIPISTITSHEHSFVFITKPELYLFEDIGGKQIGNNLKKDTTLKTLVQHDKVMMQYLDSHVSTGTNFLTPFMNLVEEMSLSDLEFSTKASAANRQGIKIDYPTDYSESLVGVPLNITFRPEPEDMVFKLINVWSKYMHKISKGIIYPRPKDSLKNKFESSCTVYQFVTKEDGESIKFYCRWTGCYPQEEPFSSYAHTGRKASGGNISVSFYAPFFDVLDPDILVAFNQTANFDYEKAEELKAKERYNKGYRHETISSASHSDPNLNRTASPYGKPIEQRTLDDYFMNGVGVIREDDEYKLRFFSQDKVSK